MWPWSSNCDDGSDHCPHARHQARHLALAQVVSLAALEMPILTPACPPAPGCGSRRKGPRAGGAGRHQVCHGGLQMENWATPGPKPRTTKLPQGMDSFAALASAPRPPHKLHTRPTCTVPFGDSHCDSGTVQGQLPPPSEELGWSRALMGKSWESCEGRMGVGRVMGRVGSLL